MSSFLRSGSRFSSVARALFFQFFFLLRTILAAPNPDGLLLLSFKSSVLSDPLSVLSSWNSSDYSPCEWKGVSCAPFQGDSIGLRVTGLALPGSRLLGSIPSELGLLQHLRYLDISDNFLNGTIPDALFNATEIETLSLSNNEISGPLPSIVANLRSLQTLNLSDNALVGQIPDALAAIPNLTFLYLSNNYFSGCLPSSGFQSLQVVDLSSNLINGSLPSYFGGGSLRSLNLSYNRLCGGIPPDLVSNASLDLSFNNLTGEIPATRFYLSLKAEAFAGNPYLCGKAVNKPCTIRSTLFTPNISASTSPLAIAAIPKTLRSDPPAGNASHPLQKKVGLRTGTITGIIVGDLAGICVVSMIFLYLYNVRKKQYGDVAEDADAKARAETGTYDVSPPSSFPTTSRFSLRCLKKSNDEETTESETEDERRGVGIEKKTKDEEQSHKIGQREEQRIGGKLVTLDGESELELETLLKASAYVLGASGRSIVYKAVLDDGTTLAVRRMGESCSIRSLKDFEAQARYIAKLRHPNILRLRGYYWGDNDKLVIFDYAPNGSLASAYLKKQGSSNQLSWDLRIKIAKGVARGLAYLHEKKLVHGNLKPSKILLAADLEPMVGDFGIDKPTGSDKPSKRSTSSDGQFDASASAGSSSTIAQYSSPYHSPEFHKNQKPNPKWDVYSFGIVLLELFSGKVFSDKETNRGFSSEWNAISGDKAKVLKMADLFLRNDIEGKEETLLECFKLGFMCASANSRHRPSMKTALEVLDKISR